MPTTAGHSTLDDVDERIGAMAGVRAALPEQEAAWTAL